MEMVFRCSHATLWLFALTFLLVQSYSDGARPSPAAAAAASRVGSPTEEVVVDRGIIAAGAARDEDVEAVPSLATATTPVAVGDRGGDGGPRRRRSVAQALRYATRRLLVGEASAGAGTGPDGAGPSCRSNNMHITCSPPSPR